MPLTLRALAEAVLPSPLYQRFAASDIAKRLARGSFWSLVNALVMKLAMLVQGIVLARLLGIGGFGEWGIVLSTIATAGVFASLGLAVAATKHVAEWRDFNPERLGRLLGLLQLIAIGTGGGICLILFSFSHQLAERALAAPQLARAVMMVGVIVLLNATAGVYQGILTGLERFGELAAINSVSTLIGVLSTIVLASWFGVDGAVVGLTVTSGLTMIALNVRASRMLQRYGAVIRLGKCWHEWRGVWRVSIPTTLASMLAIPLYWFANVVLVQQPGGYEEMGGYQAGNQWRTIVMFLPTLMLAAFLPVISSLLTTDPEKLREVQRRILFFIALISGSMAFLMISLSPWLMGLYGSTFRGFAWVMGLLAIKGSIEACNLVLQNTIVATGHAWLLLISNGTFSLLMIAGIVWLIPVYQALGLAITLLIAQGIHFLVQAMLARYAINTVRTRIST